MRARVWWKFIIDIEFQTTEKCLEEKNLITVLYHWLGYKLYNIALYKISIIFIKAIDNHHLVLHTYILPCEFQKWFDDKLMKLDIKSFSVQILIVLSPWAWYLFILIHFLNQFISNSCEKLFGRINMLSTRGKE